VHAFATGLVARGHDVEVIGEVPFHPTGVVPEGYGGRFIDRRTMDGVAVRYVWAHPDRSKRARSRIASHASYAFSASVAGVATRRVDVVLVSSPPLTVGTVGRVAALRHRVPWVMDVRDLWPDAAVALEQIGEGPALRFARSLERGYYRSATAITATTEPFKQAIESRGGAGKVTVIPNGTTDVFLDAGAAPPRPELLGEPGPFRWIYAGNVGLVAGLENAVEAARELGEGFQLVVLGTGPRRDALRELAAGLPTGTVAFIDPVPPERAAELMRAADAQLVSRAPTPGLSGMVLSKLYDACAVARPVIVAAEGETDRVAEQAGAALSVTPGRPDELAQALRSLRDDASLRERLAQGARAFGEASSRERGVDTLEDVLRRVAGGDGGRG
jgi:glycosyltransferase involved in cell wall biosynthesis